MSLHIPATSEKSKSILNDRLLWEYLFLDDNIPYNERVDFALKFLSDALEEGLVDLDLVSDLIPEGYHYSKEYGFVFANFDYA